ncbi:MAG: hypothetical protein IJ630_02620 [Treponema sp.]|nr:hypothetical protein [Treponema sp.]
MTSSKSVAMNGTFSPRVMELRQKIHDATYIDFAVQRIAQVLSRKIIEDSEQALMRRRNEPN